MAFCFPKARSYRKEKSTFEWWSIGLITPFVFNGTEDGIWGDPKQVWKVLFNTEINYSRSEYWYSFKLSVLGFGFWYSRQWGY